MYRTEDHCPEAWRELLRRVAAGEQAEVSRTVAEYLGGTSRRGTYHPDLDGVSVRAWRDEAGRYWLSRYRPRKAK